MNTSNLRKMRVNKPQGQAQLQPPVTPAPPQPNKRVMPTLGEITTVLTVIIGYFTFTNTWRVSSADIKFKNYDESLKTQQSSFDNRIKDIQNKLDISKEKTTRLEFVQKQLNDLLTADATKRTLLYNLIRLSLTDTEAKQLFLNFSQSSDAKLTQIGDSALGLIQKVKKSTADVELYERYGFECLIEGRNSDALAYFTLAESAQHGYHSVYEIGRLLRAQMTNLQDPIQRKKILSQIATQYSYGAPPDLLLKVKAISQ
jgi:hypothetical protein